MKNFFIKLISNNGGSSYSSLRFIFVIFGLTFTLGFITVWTYVSFAKTEVADVPSGVYNILAVLLLGKAIQKAAEVYQEVKK